MKGDRAMKRLIGILTLVMLGAVLFWANAMWAEEIGGVIVGEPISGSAVTSNTITIYGFWGRRAPQTGLIHDLSLSSDWATTKVQYNTDGTTSILYRQALTESLTIRNGTTYTLYVALNATMVAGRGHLNETTPTLGTTKHWRCLQAPSSGYEYMVELDADKGADKTLFPIYNVGIYPYYADLTAAANTVTTSAITGIRVDGR